jgi:hypothetical protein
MIRVRVKALNFYRVEDGPPKKPGRGPRRRAVKIPQGTEMSVSPAYYAAHKDALQKLGTDTSTASGGSKMPKNPPDELEVLRARAADLGIEIDKRWRAGRLTDEIAAAEKAFDDFDENPETEDENAGDAE